jgi:hypothetical protein
VLRPCALSGCSHTQHTAWFTFLVGGDVPCALGHGGFYSMTHPGEISRAVSPVGGKFRASNQEGGGRGVGGVSRLYSRLFRPFHFRVVHSPPLPPPPIWFRFFWLGHKFTNRRCAFGEMCTAFGWLVPPAVRFRGKAHCAFCVAALGVKPQARW